MKKPRKSEVERALELACRMLNYHDKTFTFDDFGYEPARLVNAELGRIRTQEAADLQKAADDLEQSFEKKEAGR